MGTGDGFEVGPLVGLVAPLHHGPWAMGPSHPHLRRWTEEDQLCPTRPTVVALPPSPRPQSPTLLC